MKKLTTTIWDQEADVSDHLKQYPSRTGYTIYSKGYDPRQYVSWTEPEPEPEPKSEDYELSLNGYPSIGIVVLTHDRDMTDMITRLQDIVTTSTDVCIVEGGSTKEWTEHNRNLCLNARFKHHWIPNKGKATASIGRNYGAQHVAGEYLYFIDGDCLPDSDALYAMEKAASPQAIAVGRVEFHMPDGTVLQDHRLPQFGYGYSITTFPWMMDEKNVLIPRGLFNLVGGFDVSWSANSYCWEGVDLYCKLWLRRRTPIVLVMDSLVEHRQDHEKNPDQLESDKNVEAFWAHLQEFIEKHPEEDEEVFEQWELALHGEMRDRR